jgi:hypothetical protein
VAEPLTPPPIQNAIAEQPALLTPRVWSRYFSSIRDKVLTLEQRLDALEGLPPLGARISRTTAQSIPQNVPTAVVFDAMDTLDFDHGDFWNAAQPTRFTVPGTAWYSVVADVRWSPQNLGTREMALRRNGALPYLEVSRIQGETVETDQGIPAVLYLQAGDYLELLVQHGAAAALNVTAHWTMALMQGRGAV